MKRPVARPTAAAGQLAQDLARAPRAFVPARVQADPDFVHAELPAETTDPVIGRLGWFGRLAWTTGGILVSLGLGLMADRLIADLFDRFAWLGWAGIVLLGLFVLAIVVLAGRELLALRRLRVLDQVRRNAARALANNNRGAAQQVLSELQAIYAARADLARPRQALAEQSRDLFDGPEILHLGERLLMAPLDARTKTLTAASARRVALVTAVSPRALVDIAFVVYESIRLAGAIAALYGARPGFFGFWRLTGAILTHLAVTGGLVLTDGIVEQLVGQGLAARLSQRLGEGVVNGLMTVRVGIAAARVVRPLPFTTQQQPMVRDFVGELVKFTQSVKPPA